ncbi:hypothetical protein VE00_06643 [Pseudogymnoascus sp. WSF 3629]|nr:hypothetical protein VE00_06643 [Pseudogymnoascus sp. WSF 3629]
MSDNKPTFHHLNNSQSQRILWLLEELDIEYNLVLHTRNPPTHPTAPFQSPPALVAVSPHGTAPLLITGPLDGHRTIPESLAIATYLIRTFDTSDRFGLKNGDWVRDEVITSMACTNLQRATGFIMMLDFGLIRTGEGPMGGVLDGPELRKQLGNLERELVGGPKGGFFMGEQPGRADVILEFPMTMVRHRGYLDLGEEFPRLGEWLQRCYDRPAYKRALEKGNGYDMSVFPKVPR